MVERQRGRRRIASLIGIVVIVAFTTTAAHRLVTVVDRSQVEGAYELLAAIDTGINAFAVNVSPGNGAPTQLPGRLSDLAIPITVLSLNSCGGRVTRDAPGRWARSGPFIDFYADTNGLQTPIGRVRDAIEHTMPTGESPLMLRIPGVTSTIAARLDRIVDSGDGGSMGRVRFAAPVSDTTSVLYRVAVTQRSRC